MFIWWRDYWLPAQTMKVRNEWRTKRHSCRCRCSDHGPVSVAVNQQFLRCLTMRQFSLSLTGPEFLSYFFFLNSSALTRTKTSCPLWQSVFEMCNNLYFALRLSELNGSSYHVIVPASGSSHYWQSDRNKAGMSKNLSALIVFRPDLGSMDALWYDMFGRSQH